MRQFSLSFFLVLLCLQSFAQGQKVASLARKSISLNQSWWFAKDPNRLGSPGKSLKWEKVNVPHTWNVADVMDDVPGYYRGIGWYKKKLVLQQDWKGKQLFLYFEGANQETSVFLNGKKIGGHIGGYTGFRVPLHSLKFDGTDELEVKVDNSFNESIAPLTGDFTFFGGLYRNVSLQIFNPIHFEDGEYASKGVFVQGEKVSKANAEISVSGKLTNAGKTKTELTLISVLKDVKGTTIADVKFPIAAVPGQIIAFQLPVIKVANPKLWSPENPYLYQTVTKLVDRSGKVIDEVTVNVGLRYFHFDAERGFFLNGAPYKLIGSSRHQDFEGLGNAVPSALAIKDVELIKQMGGNFLRVAHYPQDQVVLDACDRLGLLASVEIPIVNEITESEAFTNNCKNMQLEMIWQNYNHPSVVIWAYMNEVLLKMRHQNDPARKLTYLSNIEKLAQTLEDLTRTTDPTRYTMMSNHGDVNGYSKAGLVKIPQLVGWNLYQGWYGGKIEDFGPNLDKIHQQMLDKPMLVTEFGADADPRIHAFSPIKFDKSLEYAMRYHQGYLKDILSRPFIAGAAVWNLADFSSETRDETMPHVNNKGLLTLGRKPKNTFYLYQANFNPKPFVKIGDGNWPIRGGAATTNDNFFNQNVQVISNADSAELFLNGKSLGKNSIIDKVGNWQVPFTNGKNELRAIAMFNGKKIEDQSSIGFVIQPLLLNSAKLPFKTIQIAMGSERQYIDFAQKQLWLPNKPYTAGSWGSIGGEAFKIKNSSRQAYGSDKNIRGTFNDPIYQTQLVGLSAYQLDVPKGKYELTLHFAELMGNGIQSVLPYNLDSLVAEGKEVPPQRVFDVYLNGKLIIKELNLAATYGVANSVQKKFDCVVTDEKGIRLLFKSSKGQAVLNALQLRKLN